MTRLAAAALLGLALAAAAATAQPAPPYGKVIEVEFTERSPTGLANADTSRSGAYYSAAILNIEQGDRFRIEMSPVGGVEMNLHVQVEKAAGTGFAAHESSPFSKTGIDWTQEKGIPGKRAKITLYSYSVGKVNVRITKIGANDPPPDAKDGKDALIEKLRAENAELRKQLDGQKKQLEEILDLLKKGKK